MLSDVEQRVFEALGDGVPLVPRPFRVLAARAGLAEEEFLAVLRGLVERGLVRGLRAFLNHRKLGMTANALVFWAAAGEEAARLGEKLASLPEVSHCYLREVPAGWPYPVFTMIHAPTRAECLAKIARVAEIVGNPPYEVAFSTEEFKKEPLRLVREGSP